MSTHKCFRAQLYDCACPDFWMFGKKESVLWGHNFHPRQRFWWTSRASDTVSSHEQHVCKPRDTQTHVCVHIPSPCVHIVLSLMHVGTCLLGYLEVISARFEQVCVRLPDAFFFPKRFWCGHLDFDSLYYYRHGCLWVLTLAFLSWQWSHHGVWRCNQQQDVWTPHQSSQFVSLHIYFLLFHSYVLVSRNQQIFSKHMATLIWRACEQDLFCAIICSNPDLRILQAFEPDIPVSNPHHVLYFPAHYNFPCS